EELESELVPAAVAKDEGEAQRRLFVLQIVQPGLAGLMDGSVSTLAPLFAAAFANRTSWPTFLVGLAASIGAGISMAFAEALSDNGSLTGRGSPVLRGAICGVMTALAGWGTLCRFSSATSTPRPRSRSASCRWSSPSSRGSGTITRT